MTQRSTQVQYFGIRDLRENIGAYASEALAVKLYQENILTLSKASKLASMPTDEFIAVLGAAGVSVMGYDGDDLLRELE